MNEGSDVKLESIILLCVKFLYISLNIPEQHILQMCAPTVNYTRQNCGIATEKMVLNTTRVLVLQQQIFIKKIHV